MMTSHFNLRPELLTHPIIPPPLHSLSPRELLGQKWWDKQRKEAYAKNNDKCWACGTAKTDKRCCLCNDHPIYRKWLEGHEAYDIDWDTHTVTLKEIVGLCHVCHNYIHVGRLMIMYSNRTVSRQYVSTVLRHGVKVLTNAKLKPTSSQAWAYLTIVRGMTNTEAENYILASGIEDEKFNPYEWGEWKIIIDGKTYQGLSEQEWIGKYG